MWKNFNIILMVVFVGFQKPNFLGRVVGWGKRDVTL
jgi:hypothetical protein